MEGEEQLQFCAASSSRSPVCSANSSSSSCADVDASAPGPSVWLDMIQELFDLPPPSPSPASDPASTSSLLFLDGGATHAGFDTPYFADAELQQQLQSATAQDSGAASFMPSSSSSAAELQAAPPMDHDDWSLQISGAAEMPVEPFFGSRSFSGSSFLQSNFRSSLHPRDHEQHIFTGAYSFPPTGYALSSSSSAALQTPGGGAGIQKVGSAPQLAYPPFTSSAFSWPTAESSSAAQRQQLIYRHYHHSYESLADMSSASTLSFSPSAGAQYQLNPNAENSFIKSSARTGFGYPHSALQPPEMTSVQRRKQEVERGLGLVHVLLACAEAVAKGNHETAIALLIQLHPLISKTGSSMQRVAAYFAEALHARLTGIGGRSHAALLNPFFNPTPLNDVLEAYQVLYQACPYIKFAHFTCNQAIFEAFEGEKRVHIVDLDIVQGYQWPAFIQAIAARPGGAPHLRITGVGNSLQAVRDTGKQLSELAEALHVPFEFHAIGERLENLKPHMLQRRVGEALAINSINCLHPLLALPPSNKSLPNLLRMLLEQGPNVFTLVEQEASHNGPFFLGRFLEALHFYSAIFDSLDATLPQHSSDRAKVEMLIFGQEIVNIVACEDVERVKRHEKLETWRTIMETIGFQSVALSANAINQSKILLDLYSCNGYMVKESKGALQLGWQDRLTIGASAWC